MILQFVFDNYVFDNGVITLYNFSSIITICMEVFPQQTVNLFLQNIAYEVEILFIECAILLPFSNSLFMTKKDFSEHSDVNIEISYLKLN